MAELNEGGGCGDEASARLERKIGSYFLSDHDPLAPPDPITPAGDGKPVGDEAKLTADGTGSAGRGRPTRPVDPVVFDPYRVAFDLPPIPPESQTPTKEAARLADKERGGYADTAEAVARLLERMAAIPDPPDPITPAEAAEEMDDREIEEFDDVPPAPARDRTWAEYDAWIELDRRFHLDAIAAVSGVIADHSRPIDDESEGETKFRTEAAPAWLEEDIKEFLRGVLRLGKLAVARLEGGDE